MTDWDLVIVGAGPAGMSAAVTAQEAGIRVLVVDDQASPGGQIYRNIEENHRRGFAASVGADYSRGIELVQQFRQCGATYLAESNVWQIGQDGAVYINSKGSSRKLSSRYVLLATGSMERPAATLGWTLPGVMTVGAAQIMQKTAQAIPGERVWIAGCGPLAIYYAAGLAAAGHRIAGFLDTAVPENWHAAIRHWKGAIRGADYLLKGLGYLARIKFSSMRHIGPVSALEILGKERVERIRWMSNGAWHEEDADGVLLHEGVVPHTQLAQATGCAHEWNEAQACYRPISSSMGQTSLELILVAGDCSGIGGARAAALQGRIAAAEVVTRMGRISAEQRDQRLTNTVQDLQRELAIRPLLDRLYAPREEVRFPTDNQVVCRCEMVTAGSVRTAVRGGCRTVDGVKSQLRCGMGPCQGRICGIAVASLVARERNVEPDEVGPYRVRPPVKPISLGDLASLVATPGHEKASMEKEPAE